MPLVCSLPKSGYLGVPWAIYASLPGASPSALLSQSFSSASSLAARKQGRRADKQDKTREVARYHIMWYDMTCCEMIWYYITWHDVWHITYDTWHMIYDLWYEYDTIWYDICCNLMYRCNNASTTNITSYTTYPSFCVMPVSVKKTLLRRIIPFGNLAWKTPNQGLERRFCCSFAGQRLAQKGRFFTDTGVNPPDPLRRRPARGSPPSWSDPAMPRRSASTRSYGTICRYVYVYVYDILYIVYMLYTSHICMYIRTCICGAPRCAGGWGSASSRPPGRRGCAPRAAAAGGSHWL